jgi:hypothetical protein
MARRLKQWLLAALLVFGTQAMAVSYEDERLVLDIPEGFQGPLRGAPGPGVLMIGYTKPYPSGLNGTLLQINEIDLKAKARKLTDDKRAEAARKCLADLMQAVKKRRRNFSSSKPEQVTLDGHVAARTEWLGDAEGHAMTGVMYCAVIGGVMISLHTQDTDDAPATTRAEVLKAFDGIRFKPAGANSD